MLFMPSTLRLTLLILATGAVLSCASKADKVTAAEPLVQTETVANRAAREADSAYFVDVEFAKGSSVLSESSISTISALVHRARAEGELQDVKVLSWADEEYPSASRKKLSKLQRNLAAARAKSVEAHIKTLKEGPRAGLKVEMHNMAERPSAVSRWFNTTDAKFKRSLVAAGLPTTAEDAPVTGRASHAVVLVTLKP